MNTLKTGNVTQENYPEFKKLYQKAIREEKESFIFEEQEIVTQFAKYVVEYFDNAKKPHPRMRWHTVKK